MHDELRRQCRITAGRRPEPTAAVIDSQPVKAAEEVSRATFQVLPRRWVVERTLAWITRCRRTVRDCERLPGHHETIVYWAMTITMTRRLARRPAAQPVPGDP